MPFLCGKSKLYSLDKLVPQFQGQKNAAYVSNHLKSYHRFKPPHILEPHENNVLVRQFVSGGGGL